MNQTAQASESLTWSRLYSYTEAFGMASIFSNAPKIRHFGKLPIIFDISSLQGPLQTTGGNVCDNANGPAIFKKAS